jgi:hypothetical protein
MERGRQLGEPCAMTSPNEHITDAGIGAFPAMQPARILRRISLRTALRLDAAISGANGAAYLVAAQPLGDLLGMSPGLLRILGGVLVAFAAAVALTAARADIRRPAVVAIIAVNLAWALASVAAACAGWDSPATAGTIWIVAQAVVVAGFADLQAWALRR